jgi:enterochelin esterase family protein
VLAQVPARESSPNDTLRSTEVGPDRTVTFPIYAPRASEAIVTGDFGAPAAMTRNDEGVWSVTVGPLDLLRRTHAYTPPGYEGGSEN